MPLYSISIVPALMRLASLCDKMLLPGQLCHFFREEFDAWQALGAPRMCAEDKSGHTHLPLLKKKVILP